MQTALRINQPERFHHEGRVGGTLPTVDDFTKDVCTGDIMYCITDAAGPAVVPC